MQAASTLPDELQLYLVLVGLLREKGLTCASMQVDCRPQNQSGESTLTVTGTAAARGLLAPVLEREVGRHFDPQDTTWRVSLDEAWKVIDCRAVV
jgi:hypothetical protein